MPAVVVPTPQGDYEFPDQAAADRYLAASSRTEERGGTGASPDADLAAIDSAAEKRAASEPTAGAYLGNRAKKGFGNFMGLPGDLLEVNPKFDNLIAETQDKLDRAPSVYMKKYLESRLRELNARKADGRMSLNAGGSVMATSDMYKEAMGYDKNMKTDNDLLRYAGGVAEMAGAGGPLASVVKNPLQAYSLFSGTAYGGVGMEAGGDTASAMGLNRDLGEAAGAALGMTGPALLGQGASAGLQFAKSRFSPEFAKKKAEAEALQKVSGLVAAHPESEANLARAEELRGRIPGYQPGAAASTGAPGLVALERSLAAQSPENLATAAKHVGESAQAIENFVATTYAQGALDTPKKIAVLAKKKTEALAAARANIDEELVGLNAAFERNTNPANGELLRRKLNERNSVLRAEKDGRYAAVDEEAARVGVTDDIGDIVAFTKKTLADDFNGFQPENIPSVFREVKSMFLKEAKPGRVAKETPTGKKIYSYDEPAAAPTEVSFDKMMSLRRRVNNDIAETYASSGTDRETKLRLLGGMKEMIEMRVQQYSDPEKYGRLGALLQDAEGFYKTEYAPRFKQGFGFDAQMRNSRAGGGMAYTPEEITTKLLKPTDPQAARDFKFLYGDDPEAMGALKDAWLDTLHKRTSIFDRNGVVKPTALDNFMRQHADALREVPFIRTELQALSTDATALLARREAISVAQKKLADNKFIDLVQNQDPEKVIGVAISDEKAMRVLSGMAKKDGALAQEALARRVAEKITEAPDPAAFLNAHRETVSQVFGRMGPEHVRNMDDIVDAISILKRADVPRNVHGAPTMQDPMMEATGSSLRSWIASLMSIERGRTGVLQEGGFMVGRYLAKLTTGHRDAVMQAALYDPHFSKVLSEAFHAKAPIPDRIQTRLAEEFGKIGVRAFVAGEED